ncbi:hypothetical protein DF185_20145 [Marinifilum breve]|uniref:Tetratricopeptide repeat protein n=1 Tax=Marinifilum breve TaxID=2184082 RepID=A0A2V3ZV94_9BACT|nr:hypothetical protein [Marinifilum breve]PXX96953.1 hypothetical protein DF185_20145 [Marinifilum breve]
MEQSRIQDWVKDSKTMDKFSHRELKYLVEKYPFFEVAHLLLLKNLNDSQSIRFKEELRNSSLYISDRRQLYLLLNDRLKLVPFEKTESNEEETSLEVESENLQEPVTETRLEKPVREELFELSSEVSIVENVEKDILVDTDHMSNDEILELSEPGIEPIEIEPKTEEANKQEKSDSDLLVAATEVYHIGYGGNLYTLKEDEDPKEETSKEEDRSFTDWMEVVDKGEETSKSEPEKTAEPKKKNLDLIDNFIQNEPSIQRNIKVADKQEDISADSVRENDSFMSETLASIYVKQRLFDKAIAVYRKLELKNPEKNVYFASQIEKIEKLKNSK